MRPMQCWLVAVLFPCLLATLAAAPEPRFPVVQDPQKGWGFIDKTGTLVIPYQFAAVGNFQEGLAPVLVKHKWGYIDTAGKMVIPPQFVEGESFSEGLAAVRVHDEESLVRDPYGYIDTSGKLVIPARYSYAAPFSSGRARVNFENKLIFIDKSAGTIPFPEGVKKAYGDFSESLAPVGDNRTSATGYIDPTGKLVIPLTPGLGAPFSEGLAAAIVTEGKFPHVTKTLTFVDTSGKTVVQTEFSPATTIEDPTHFSDGLCRVVHFNRKTGSEMRYIYLDKTGKVAVEVKVPRLHETYDFHEGLARIKVGGDINAGMGGKFGYIDKTGNVIIPPHYDAAGDFRDGLAQVVTEDNGQAYIDKTGKAVYGTAPLATESPR